MLDGTHFFECECGADEHTLKFVVDKEWGQLHATIFLNDYNQWHKRVWNGIKYIFGHKCKYGHFDSWILRREDADRLKMVLNEIKEK